MSQLPIAIVGRGAVLPGAHDPATLWRRILGRDDLTGASTHAMWGLHPAAVCADPLEPAACARGGYVTDFDRTWRADGFRLPADHLAALPEGWRWLLHATREGLREAGIGADAGPRAGLVLGSLGYPTRSFADVAARRWCGDVDADDPALAGQTGALRWTMEACGLEGPRLALDAACASGLYALKAACDVLQAGRADVMVAAGLNAADDLFLHIGFTALAALSRTGRSSPLSTLADGLLPAEGAAVLVLKRLDDAVAAGDHIYGIVRGVGLSNDGRGSGLLAPTTSGQQRAIRAGWAAAGLEPGGIDFLECHATGTPVGDREEVLSIRAVFGDQPIRLGSFKAQVGHLITASGTAGLLKILGAFEHATIPPAPRVSLDHPIDALEGSALTLPGEAESWTPAETPRRAAINAFGFGGCNAHAVIDGPEAAEDLARRPRGRGRRKAAPTAPTRALAMVACEVAVGAAADTDATLRVLLGLDPATRRIGDIHLALKGLGFPPADLQQTLPQQLLLLRAAQAIRPHLSDLDRERVGLFVGTDVDPSAARHGCRWRLASLLERPVTNAERDAVIGPLQAAGVLGTMPNMPANRLNSLLDVRGPGQVVSDGFQSGRRAFECAADAIARGELDAALVGAVDASGGAFGDDPSLADTAVLMLLVPADAAGDRDVLAIFEAAPDEPPSVPPALPWPDAGAAHELLQLAVGALCCHHALWPADPGQPWVNGERVLHLHGWRVHSPWVRGLAEEAPLLDSSSVADLQEEPGELAWVFTGAAAAYPGAGRTLLRAFPGMGDELLEMAPRLAATLPALLAQRSLSLIDQLKLATLVSQTQALLLRHLDAEPQACLGLSSGETNAIMATRAWSDPDALFADVERSGMYDRHLAGDYETLRRSWGLGPDAPVSWRCYRIIHPVADLHAAAANRARVRVLIVHHERDAVIGGDDQACRELIAELGASAVPINHDLLVHCVELEPFARTWYDVHHRRTRSFTSPRLYANAINGVFVPDDDRCAEMLTTQARSMVQFHPTVERAYADGVRTFLELGPRAACSGWIHEILGDRVHTAAALDGTRGSLTDAADALTAVHASGHTLNVAWWNDRVRDLRIVAPATESTDGMVVLPGHRTLPAFETRVPMRLSLPPAPSLAPVLPDRLHVVAAAPQADIAVIPHPNLAELGSALAALATCQYALLQVQELAVAHLSATDTTVANGYYLPAAPESWSGGEAIEAVFSPTFESAWPGAPLTVEPHDEPAPEQQAMAVAAAVPAVETPPSPRPWPGEPPAHARAHVFTREQLAIHAGGTISEIFGPLFVKQDSHRRQVRMPMEPLLLADRVTGMVGEPASMKTGTVWTETDIRPDSWYLYDGRMPTGILIESGQADLFLISWLGIDLQDRGERVYRLLGCELTFHGGLPGIGDTLRYEIHIDSHARHGDIGLFFFHYDCWTEGDLRLSVRKGQAGFFTDEELAESAGVLWNPDEDRPDASAPLAGPRPGVTPDRDYDDERVTAFAKGDVLSAFGQAFVRAASHTRTPRIPGGQMQLFDRVDELDVTGGPWHRGYMRATLDVHPDQWFFPGHFKNDPCMPGTLMFEGCLQTMAFYMAALGYTIERDGWRFEPVQGQPYLLRCRGQVTPQSKVLTYEVFVAEFIDGPEPTLVADLMCTVDGLRAFHCRRMALRLTPDNPLGPRELAAMAPDREPVAEYNGFRYGQASLLACANGNPVDAFGALYAVLPPTRRVPRLPAPPYHFISRVTSLSHPPGGMQAGVIVETAYDIPPDAWYFTAHPTGQMPACVLVEAALQPCGWLASYVGCAVNEAEEVFFRNLDGAGVLHRAVRADDGCLRVKSTLKSLARAGGMTLVSFDVVCTVEHETIYELKTTFGFFPKAALEGQAGLPADEAERTLAETRADRDLLEALGPEAAACLPRSPARMCERVTERRVEADGRTALRGEKSVRPDEWFFTAHFFQDPVQPGSLGVEALVQLLQAHLLLEGAAEAVPGGVFADMVSTDAGTWTFRGQVLPESRLVSLTLYADAIEKTPTRWTVRAQGSVWVDGRRIYHLRNLTVSFDNTTPRPSGRSVHLDPATQPWWNDHRPTFAAPVLPGMAMLGIAMDSAPDAAGIDDFVLRRWLVLDEPQTIQVERKRSEEPGLPKTATRDPAPPRTRTREPENPRTREPRIVLLQSSRPLADGVLVLDAGPAPEPIAPLPANTPALADPYASGAMFHGPAYHRVVSGRRSAAGADLVVRLEPAADRRERISHIVLDAGLHGVPHDDMTMWFAEVAPGQVAYPAHVERFRVYAPVPAEGTVDVRVRPGGVRGSARFPRIHAQFLHEGRVWADLVLVEACFPSTRLGQLAPDVRRAFLRDGVYVEGARLSDVVDGTSVLTTGALASADWLPGTVHALYRLSDADTPLTAVVAREHAAAALHVHPRVVTLAQDGRVHAPALPLVDYGVAVESDGRQAVASDAWGPRLDAGIIERWWKAQDWQSRTPALQALFLAACRQFVRGVRLLEPEAIRALYGQPLLLLANHQVAVESVLAGTALPPVLGRPLLTLAKREHQDTWVGRLAMGLNDDRRGPAIVYVDRDRQQDMLERLAEMAHQARSGARSLMVHVEGTRATRGRQPVSTISAVWADLAVQAGLTIVPLRYCGGLPEKGTKARLEFPHGLGGQELVLGRPLSGAALSSLPLNVRRDRILAGLAELEAYDFDPQPDPPMAARVRAARRRWNLDEVQAVFLLLQADAQGWTLDSKGLPADAMAQRSADDAFWAWFEEHGRTRDE